MINLHDKIRNDRHNNVNAIRLFLALMVIFSHSYPLSGAKTLEPLVSVTDGMESFGTVAVDLFFLISGMLITASWLRSNSMKDFLMKRVLRIYPGFVVAMVLTVVTIWIVCPEFRIGAEQGIVWLRTFFTDLVSLNNHSLIRNGIFSGNPFPNYGNESLWTIQKEFACYLLVAMLGLFCLFKQRGLILTATLAIYLIYCHKLFAGEATEHSIFRFVIYFLVGMNVWLWRDKIPFTRWFAFGSLAVLLVAIPFKPWFSVIFPYLGAYCTLWFGYGLRLPFLDWTDKTDLSYGTYLYAWPIQQIIAMNESLRHHLLNFIISTPIALCLAWLSWNLIERRLLAIKKSFQVDNIPATTVNAQKSLT